MVYHILDRLAFNWTMTYRMDSDFPIPYAWIDRTMPLPAPVGSTQLTRCVNKSYQINLTNDENKKPVLRTAYRSQEMDIIF
jgi:hypothetical protein